MREFWKKTFVRAAIGCVLGVLVGLGFLLPFGIGAFYDQHGMGGFALHLAMSGLLGVVNMGSTTIYSLEHWSVLRCTVTHFLITMTCLCTVGFSMGWFTLHDPVTPWMLGSCVVIYFIIWLIISLRCKREIRQINAALKDWKSTQRDE